MSVQIPLERLKPTLLQFIDETFSQVHGMYLDKGTTLYETLEGVTAEEASRSASSKTATIAAQVEHVRFYLDVLDEIIRTHNIDKTYNWREIWETVREVTPEQWEDLKRRLHESHDRVMATINSFENWDGPFDVGGAISIIAHTAYHLGGIRQALGVIRANSQTSVAAH
ncbi:MAG TPA: DinB family protein [Pyrinomonadaceae bacterium]|nr:DinB family protein [Pyrinomonadaceae bacterium]